MVISSSNPLLEIQLKLQPRITYSRNFRLPFWNLSPRMICVWNLFQPVRPSKQLWISVAERFESGKYSIVERKKKKRDSFQYSIQRTTKEDIVSIKELWFCLNTKLLFIRLHVSLSAPTNELEFIIIRCVTDYISRRFPNNNKQWIYNLRQNGHRSTDGYNMLDIYYRTECTSPVGRRPVTWLNIYIIDYVWDIRNTNELVNWGRLQA